MKGKGLFLKLFLSLVLVGIFISGCAYGNFGKIDLSKGVPSGLNGQSKSDIIKTLGVPDSSVNTGSAEYWRFCNKKGKFIILFGETTEKDLILKFEGNNVTSSYVVDKGSSIGIFTTQGSVAN